MTWWKNFWPLRQVPFADVTKDYGSFVVNFADVLDEVINRPHTQCRILDPWTAVFVLPKTDLAQYSDFAEDLEPCLKQLTRHSAALSSLTWSALRKADPQFRPSWRQWADSRKQQALDGELDIAFFVASEELINDFKSVLEERGYRVDLDSESSTVNVFDDGLRIDIGLEAMHIEALWTMKGFVQIIEERCAFLPIEFAAYRSLQEALQQRFQGISVQKNKQNGAWDLDWQQQRGQCVYRKIIRQWRQSGLDKQGFLARCQFEDLVQHAPLRAIAKAPGFLSAYPDSYYKDFGSYVEVLAREADDSIKYIRKSANEPEGRNQHLNNLRQKELASRHFSGLAYFAELESRRALCIVGEQALSLIVDSGLLRGLLIAAEWPEPLPQKVQLRSYSEQSLLIAETKVSSSALEALLGSLRTLTTDLFNLRGDFLDLNLVVDVQAEALGKFSLKPLSGHYFALRKAAEQAEKLKSAGRAAYYHGLRFQLIGRHEQALNSFLHALRFDRDDGELNLLVGRSYNDDEEYVRALPFLQKAHEHLPRDVDVLNSLGVAYQNDGQEQRALHAFEQALNLQPDDVSLMINLGRAYFANDMLERARKTLMRALERDPQRYDTHASLAMLNFQDDDFSTALEHARLALAVQPEDEAMRELVALIFFVQEDEG